MMQTGGSLASALERSIPFWCRLSGRRWSIPFYAVNVEGVETDIRAAAPEQQALDRSQLRVGDAVGFHDRQNQDKYGRVVALNRKTATILTTDDQKWRVSYQFLFPVIESNE